MPKKYIKTFGGKTVPIKSILLPNGNLLFAQKVAKNVIIWREATPGTSQYKFWWPVREEEPDPRETARYKEHVAQHAKEIEKYWERKKILEQEKIAKEERRQKLKEQNEPKSS